MIKEYKGLLWERVDDPSQILLGDKLFHEGWMDSGTDLQASISVDSRVPGIIRHWVDDDFKPHYSSMTDKTYYWFRQVTEMKYSPSQEGDRDDDI